MKDKDVIEGLLHQRYKVIAHYPNCEFAIGEVLQYEPETETTRPVLKDELGYETYTINPDNYPAIFKPLQWWEERKPEEMPEYVKWTHPGVKTLSDYFKVFQWQKNSVGAWLCDVKEAHLYIRDVVPATEAEYLDYLTQQNKKA